MLEYTMTMPRTAPQGANWTVIEETQIVPVTLVRTRIDAPAVPRASNAPDDLAQLTIDDIEARLAPITAPDYRENRRYFDGDHWQEGRGWRGPLPVEGDHSDIRTMLKLIAPTFVSANIIAEVTRRKHDAAVGRQPAWTATTARAPGPEGLTLTADESTLIGEATTALTLWWNQKGGHALFQRLCLTALLGNRAPVRVFVPEGRLVETSDGSVNLPLFTSPKNITERLAEAMDSIFADDPDPYHAGLLVRRRDMRTYGAYVHHAEDENDQDVAEISYLERDANGVPTTVIRLIREGDAVPQPPDGADGAVNMFAADRVISEVRIPLGGQIPINELTLDKLISPQVRRLQQAINKDLTMADRNVDLAGFLERTIVNSQMPGHYEDVKDAQDRVIRRKFVRDEHAIGGGAVTYLQGYAVREGGEDGRVVTFTTPNVIYKDPVPNDVFERTMLMNYARLLAEVQQLHYMIAGQQYASGDARIQARTEFEDSLKEVKTAIDDVGRWLLTCVLRLAAYLAGYTGRYDGLRMTFDSRINPGPVTSESKRSTVELRTAGLRSRETAMVETGIDDPDAEARMIDDETKAGVVIPQRSSGRVGEGIGTVAGQGA